MIENIQVDGKACPKIFCDSCGKEIVEVESAGVVFTNFLPDNERSTIAYVHKDYVGDNCTSRVEEAFRSKGKEPGFVELSQHLEDLISNIRMLDK
ncbi:hypothetical protein [Shewanella algae]|uniref:hypothetical protein n=1 Tax=Shewanella algae TaxID=38313 RepID=UPI001AAC4DF6|nr:hypothetical protein [Shewanella algae]MBO2683547.1 hypothetical protein [Shewanella algae]QTE84338.1 hypothetical protein JKK46_11065 [Shewanella algae]QTE84347.1 hypothetical protein JKK46_11120 [Shewanella algae]